MKEKKLNAAFYEGNKKICLGSSKETVTPDACVKLKIAYCGICGTDVHIFNGKMDKRVKMPQVTGHEVSGVIVEAGKNVKGLLPGMKATVMPLDWCGECPACRAGHMHICSRLKFLGIDTEGGFQEYWIVPAETVFRIPDNIPLDIAAMAEPLAVACHDLRRSGLKAGNTAIIIGGGPIGTLIGLVARQAGIDVMVAEINPYRIELLAELGLRPENLLDGDFEEKVKSFTNGAGADAVFEVTGRQEGINLAVKLPKVRGKIVAVGIFSKPPEIDLFQFFWKELELYGARVYEREDFETAIELIKNGQVPVNRLISAIYSLEELEKGLKEMEKGGNIMKILIKCSE